MEAAGGWVAEERFARYSQSVPTGYEHLSEDELWDSLNRFPPDASGKPQAELLGEYSIEEAVQLGAWFEDPDEQDAFDRAVEALGLRYPD